MSWTAEGVLQQAVKHGPWHTESDGRIRNVHGLDPYAAVSGSWMPRPGDDDSVHRVIEAADFPSHPFRPRLEAVLLTRTISNAAHAAGVWV